MSMRGARARRRAPHNGGVLKEQRRARVEREALLPYVIRPARREDLDALEWFGEYRHMRLVEASAWASATEGGVLFYVAEANGMAVAQLKVALRHDEDVKADGRRSGYLYGLRVFGPFQRLGIGSALIDHAEQQLCERSFQWATIAAERENLGALRLYERRGYSLVRQRHRSWAYLDPDGAEHRVEVDEMLMRKRLSCG